MHFVHYLHAWRLACRLGQNADAPISSLCQRSCVVILRTTVVNHANCVGHIVTWWFYSLLHSLLGSSLRQELLWMVTHLHAGFASFHIFLELASSLSQSLRGKVRVGIFSSLCPWHGHLRFLKCDMGWQRFSEMQIPHSLWTHIQDRECKESSQRQN